MPRFAYRMPNGTLVLREPNRQRAEEVRASMQVEADRRAAAGEQPPHVIEVGRVKKGRR